MIRKVPLGTTGIVVSQAGLGTVKFGRNQGVKYPDTFELPTDHEIIQLLDCAYELGINLLDTAPAYGTAEDRLGKALKGQRNRWVICTKVGEEFKENQSEYNFSPEATRHSIIRSLQKLNVDVLDVVFVHSNGEDEKIIKEHGTLEVLKDLKKAGYLRAFGMSTKTVEGGLLAVERSDVVMVTYNPSYTKEVKVIEYAEQKNKGVFIKKALASGHLSELAEVNPVLKTMQFIFKQKGITSVVLGTLNPQHLQENVNCIAQASLD